MDIKVKTATEIFNEVKDFDLVITNDKSLMITLNSMLEQARLGLFTVTPFRYSSIFLQNNFLNSIFDDSSLLLTFQQNIYHDGTLPNLSLSRVNFVMIKIIEFWTTTGSLQNIEESLEKEIYQYVPILRQLPSIYYGMEKMNYPKNKKIAVIGFVDIFNKPKELLEVKNLINFTAIEKINLPTDAIIISPFKENSKNNLEVETFIFESIDDLISMLTTQIPKELSETIAIIATKDNPEEIFLKRELANNGYAVHENKLLKDEEIIKFYNETISFLLNPVNHKIKDIKSFFSIWEINFTTSDDEINVTENNFGSNLTNDNLEQLRDLRSNLLKKTFLALHEEVFSLNYFDNINLEIVKESLFKLLTNLRIGNKVISLDLFHEYIYFLNNFSPTMKSTVKGVIFGDPMSSAFVPRENVFFLGISRDWTRKKNPFPGISPTKTAPLNTLNFLILMSQGKSRYIFTTRYHNATENAPPYHFDELWKSRFNSFSDLPICNTYIIEQSLTAVNATKLASFSGTMVTEKFDCDQLETLSASFLSNFVICPKKRFFSETGFFKEKVHTLFGKIIHEFAEINFSDPSYVESKGITYFIEKSKPLIENYVNPYQWKVQQRKLELSFKRIIRFHKIAKLAKENLTQSKLITNHKPSRHPHRSLFGLDDFDKSLNNEFSFENKEIKINGIADLLLNDLLIVDYKSAKNSLSNKEIFSYLYPHENKKPISQFQPLFYLYWLSTSSQNEDIFFEYFFTSILEYHEIKEEVAQEKLQHFVSLVKTTFFDFICEPGFLKALQQAKSEASKSSIPNLKFVLNIASFEFLRKYKDIQSLKDNLYDDESWLNILYELLLNDKDFKVYLGGKDNIEKCAKELAKSIQCIRFSISPRNTLKNHDFFKITRFFQDEIEYLKKIINDVLIQHKLFRQTKFKPTAQEGTCKDCEYTLRCLRDEDEF